MNSSGGYKTKQRQAILDYLIDKLASRGISKVSARPLIVLRMGLYAIDSLGSVPDHAAVNEAVNLAKKVAKGSDKFVNGVLRTYIREKDKYIIPEERLDLNLPLNELYARIRGLSLTPGGHFILNGLKLKVFKASIASNEQKGEIGEIVGVKKGIFVSVKGGVIRLEEVQLEGKKAMDAASFANGMHNLLGSKLE